MKNILILFISVSLLSSKAFAFEPDERDKQYHMGASYALQTSTSLFYKHQLKLSAWEAAFYGALTTLAIGATKEYAFDDKADKEDMAANLIGVGAAVPLVFIEF